MGEDKDLLWWEEIPIEWPGTYIVLGAASLGLAYVAFRAIVAVSSIFDGTDYPGRRRQDDFDFTLRRRARDIPLYPKNVHLKCSHWAEKGGRQYNEDRFAFMGKLLGKETISYFGVFDGHGGSLASEYAREHLHQILIASQHLESSTKTALVEAFLQTDEQLIGSLQSSNRVDGTTALVAVINGNKLHVANVGDSRALLIKRDGKCLALSRDHKPSLPDEMKRITDMGGKVIFWGRWRVEGVLAVSRALGDQHLKPYVSAEPEVTEHLLSEDDEDQFLVMATDGIWDVLSNEVVAQTVMKAAHDVKWIARKLCDEAWLQGSMDNMTAVVIDLRDHRVKVAAAAATSPVG